ncbi:energy transducer TonB [Massilia sp. W12]|uniref:energy transducer TonB n=1 Tax=Massilia sp. W12 TaxID=3126507 RepID=UPI0030D139F1
MPPERAAAEHSDTQTLPATAVTPLVDCPDLHYPRAALLDGAQGVSRLALQLDADGKVQSAQIVRSNASATLDQAALRAAASCQAAPGSAAPAEILLDIDWRVEE